MMDSALVHCKYGHKWIAELILDDGGFYFIYNSEYCPQCGELAVEMEEV